MIGDVHTYPESDLIVHDASDQCPCAPDPEPIMRADGSLAWFYLHNQLRGGPHDPGAADPDAGPAAQP